MYKESIEKLIHDKAGDEIRVLVGDFAILWNLYEKEVVNIAKNKYRAEHHLSRKVKVYPEQYHEVILETLEDKDFFQAPKTQKEIDNNFKELKLYMSTCKEKLGFSPENIIHYFHIYSDDVEHEETPGEKEVNALFDSNNWNLANKLHLLLIVAYRVRNNMFHGIKLVSSLKKEEKLFIICNNVLSIVINSHKKPEELLNEVTN